MAIARGPSRLTLYTGSTRADSVLTVDAVAARLGVSSARAQRLCMGRAIPSVKIGRQIYVLESVFRERTAPMGEAKGPLDALMARRRAEGQELRLETLRRRRERIAAGLPIDIVGELLERLRIGRAREPQREPVRQHPFWDSYWYFHRRRGT